MSAPTLSIPGYTSGTWTIDPANSQVGFTVRHLGVATVHGRFNEVTGEIVTGESLENSSVQATISADSIDTGFPARDTYIKGDDVLAVGEHKALTFASTGVRSASGQYLVDGELTVRGITRPVTFTVEPGGFGADPTKDNLKVLGLSARTTVKRSDFELSSPIPAGIISENITIQLDVQASLGA